MSGVFEKEEKKQPNILVACFIFSVVRPVIFILLLEAIAKTKKYATSLFIITETSRLTLKNVWGLQQLLLDAHSGVSGTSHETGQGPECFV